MTIKQMFAFQLKETEIKIGEVINIASQIKGNLASLAEDTQLISQDLDQFLKIMAELQISLEDVAILTEGSSNPVYNKTKPEQLAKTTDAVKKLINHLSPHIPKRDVPVMPRGNPLAVALFGVTNTLLTTNLFWDEAKEEFKEQSALVMNIDQFFEAAGNLFYITSRWANLLINKKEYLWVEPGAKPPEATTPTANQSHEQTLMDSKK